MIKVFGDKSANVMKRATTFFTYYLCIPQDTIILIYCIEEKDKANGMCFYEKALNEFHIDVCENENITMMVETLAHEMVHVKQYLFDDLEKEYDSSIPYLDRWWEIEAFEEQEKMVIAFVNHIQRKEAA